MKVTPRKKPDKLKKTKPKKPKPKPKPKEFRYTCPHCNKQFVDNSSWSCHIQIHSTELPYKCDICEYKCKIKKYLSRHIKKAHTKPVGHQCPVCGKCFHFDCKLRVHMRVHTGEKPYKCNMCDKAFSSSYSLNGHKMIHTGEKPFQCIYCDYACRDNSTIRRHIERHEGISKDYPCAICNKNFKKKETLQLHVEEVHLELDTRKYPCAQCGKMFKTKGTLNMHRNTVHKKGNRVKCEICGGRVTKNNIQAHMRRHIDVRPYKCSFKRCGRRFKDKGDLSKHSRIHYPDLQYLCNVCNRRFARKNRLTAHMKLHTNKNNVQCDHCGEMYPTKIYLSRHIRNAHRPNSRHFICDICGLVTYTKKSIITHLKYGHGTENDSKCQICETDYKTYLSLKEHYLKYHSVVYNLLEKKKEDGVTIKDEPVEEIVANGELPEFIYEVEVQKHEEIDLHDNTIEVPILDPPESYTIDTDTITYSKKVLSEDISRSLMERENKTDDAFDDFFIGHVLKKPDDIMDIPKEIVDEKKKERVEKCLEKLLAEVRMRKQFKVLEKMRRRYNRRIKKASNSGNKKEKKSIRYYKNPEENNKSTISLNTSNVINDTLKNQNNNHYDEIIHREINSDKIIDQDIDQVNGEEIDSDTVKHQNIENNDKKIDNDKTIVQDIDTVNGHEIVDQNIDENDEISDQVVRNDTIIEQDIDKVIDEERDKINDDINEKEIDNSKTIDHENKKDNDTVKDMNNSEICDREIGNDITINQDIEKVNFEKITDNNDEEINEGGQINEEKIDGQINDEKVDSQINDENIDGQINDAEIDGQTNYEKIDGQINDAEIDGQINNGKIDVDGPTNDEKIDGEINDDEIDGQINDKQMHGQINIEKMYCQINDEEIDGQINDEEIDGQTIDGKRDDQTNGEKVDGQHNVEKVDGQINYETIDDKINDEQIDGQINDEEIDDQINDEEIDDDDDAKDSDYRDSDFEINGFEETNRNGKVKFNTHQCYICFKLFKTKTDLKRHCTVHFDICNDKMLKKCPFCGYVTNLQINKHIKTVHKINIDIHYSRIKERETQNGSKYVFEIDKDCDLEIIPSISNLNKIASMKIDEKNRDAKNLFLGTTKLVRKGNDWVVEKKAVTIDNEHLLPEFTEEEYQKLKYVGDNYLERIRSLSILAKNRGAKILFPCEGCDKICLTLSALKLHNRKHEANPKRFKPKVWKHKLNGNNKNNKKGNNNKKCAKNNKNNAQKGKNNNKNKNNAVTNERNNKNIGNPYKRSRLEIVGPNNKAKIETEKLPNRYADPNPVKNKHKCDKKLIEFYKTNIKGGDIEFWQFLKIFNKMSRENVNDFKDLENRFDFGMHNIKNFEETNECPPSDNTVQSKTEAITNNSKMIRKKIAIPKKKAFTRAIMISKKDYMKRLELKNQMRKRLQECET